MNSNSFETTYQVFIDLEHEDDVLVEVTAYVIPGSPSTRYQRNGDPGDAPIPEEVEILSIYRVDDNTELDNLSNATIDYLIEKCPLENSDDIF